MTTETIPEPLYTLEQARALLIPGGHCIVPLITGAEMMQIPWVETRLGARGSRE